MASAPGIGATRVLGRALPGEWFTSAAGLVAVALVALPLLVLAHASLVPGGWHAESRYTLEHYRAVLSSPGTLGVVWSTLVVSVGATTLATVLGVSLAWLVTRTDMPGSRFLEPLNLIPFYLSPLIGAIAWIYLAAPRVGLLNRVIGDWLNIYGLWGMAWVMGLFFTPEIYLFASGALRRIDPALEESARVHGSGLLTTTWRITLPLIRPAVLSGAVLVFVSTLGEFSIPVTLGTPVGQDVLVTRIYAAMEEVPPNHNLAAAFSVLLISPTIALLLAHRALLEGRSYEVIGGRAYRPRRVALGRWRWVALAGNVVYLACAVGLPLVALLAVSLSRVWVGQLDVRQLTVEHMQYVLLQYPLTWRALRNSLSLAVAGATVAVGIGLCTAWLLHRTGSPLRGVVDLVVSVPIAIPGVVLGVAVLIAYLRTPLYGTLLILLVAYVTRFLPYGHRAAEVGLLSLGRELEEASRTCGAPWWRTVWRVVVPLVQPALLSGWLLLFIIYVREFPMSLLLARAGTETLSVALYALLLHQPAGVTASFALLQVVILLGAAYGLRGGLVGEIGPVGRS